MSRRPDHLGKRVDFSAHTKKLARERAGHVCQYPGCDASAHDVDLFDVARHFADIARNALNKEEGDND